MSQQTLRWFDDWRNTDLTCKKCGWLGQVDEKQLTYNDSMVLPEGYFRCPRCEHYLMTIEYSAPTEEILANLNKLSEKDRQSMLAQQDKWNKFEQCKLNSPDQLPELGDGPNFLTWDLIERANGELSNAIQHDQRVIWEQPALWEGSPEFARITQIIKQRYGDQITDLRPTQAADFYMLGDDFGAQRTIDAARRSLGWKRLP